MVQLWFKTGNDHLPFFRSFHHQPSSNYSTLRSQLRSWTSLNNDKISLRHSWRIPKTIQQTVPVSKRCYLYIVLWDCAKPSNTQIIQRIQSKTLRIVFNSPWYVSNKTLHKDSGIPLIEDEIIRMTNRYLLNLTGHSNEQVNQLHVSPRPEEDYTDSGPQMCYNKRQ